MSTTSMMTSFERKVSRFITFKAPKMVTVQDWKLGLAHKLLQGFFLFIIMSDLVGNKKYLATRVPTGFAGFWASKGNMLQDQKAVIDNAASYDDHYCNSNHHYYEDLLLGKYAHSVCELQDYNELHLKGEDEMFISTSYIQETTAVEDCSAKAATGACSIDYAAVLAAVPEPPPGVKKECYCMRDTSKFVDTMVNDPNGANVNKDRCTCTSRRHVFTPGVEAMSINFEAGMSIMWPSGFGVCSGTSVIAKPKLYVRRRNSDINLHTFEAGEKLSLPIKVLLDLADLGDQGLDSPNKVTTPSSDGSVAIDQWGHSQRAYNEACDHAYYDRPSYCSTGWSATADSAAAASEGRVPTYRQTGLAIAMNVKFHHTCDEDDSTYAVVEVANRNIAWNSKGSSTQFSGGQNGGSFPKINPTTKKRSQVYTDTYKFGVKIVFTFEGESVRTDIFVIVSKVAEAFMLVMISSSLMAIVVFYLHPKAKFYKTRRDEEVNFDHINARLAAQTAMGIISFKGMDTDHNGDVSLAELERTFSGMYPTATAHAMATHIMEIADTGGDGKLNFNEFMRIIVEDVKSFDIMLHSLRPKYVEAQGAEKLPPPFDMWEKRTTPDGVPYFANNITKTTSWADPRSQIANHSLQQQQQQFIVPQVVVAGGQQQMHPVVVGGGQIIPQGGQQMTA